MTTTEDLDRLTAAARGILPTPRCRQCEEPLTPERQPYGICARCVVRQEQQRRGQEEWR
jgi:hypothetical protein